MKSVITILFEKKSYVKWSWFGDEECVKVCVEVWLVPWHSPKAADPPDTWRRPHCNRRAESFCYYWNHSEWKTTADKRLLTATSTRTISHFLFIYFFKSIFSAQSDYWLRPWRSTTGAKRHFFDSLWERRCVTLSFCLSLQTGLIRKVLWLITPYDVQTHTLTYTQ